MSGKTFRECKDCGAFLRSTYRPESGFCVLHPPVVIAPLDDDSELEWVQPPVDEDDGCCDSFPKEKDDE